MSNTKGTFFPQTLEQEQTAVDKRLALADKKRKHNQVIDPDFCYIPIDEEDAEEDDVEEDDAEDEVVEKELKQIPKARRPRLKKQTNSSHNKQTTQNSGKKVKKQAMSIVQALSRAARIDPAEPDSPDSSTSASKDAETKNVEATSRVLETATTTGDTSKTQEQIVNIDLTLEEEIKKYTSIAYSFFNKNEKLTNVYTCLFLCGHKNPNVKISEGSTSHLWKHLTRWHSDDLRELFKLSKDKKNIEKQVKNTIDKANKKHQKNVSNLECFIRRKTSSLRGTEMEIRWSLLGIKNNWSFNSQGCDETKEFFKEFGDLILPNRQLLSGVLLTGLY